MDPMLEAARDLLLDRTPLKTDCGRLCGARCCNSLEGEESGMLLFPGEAEAYAGKPGWKVLDTEAGALLVCPGACDRAERPLACRVFPLLPVYRDEGIQTEPDDRARGVCPLYRYGTEGMTDDFVAAVTQAGTLLCEDPAQRGFLLRLTKEQDDLKQLRKTFGGR